MRNIMIIKKGFRGGAIFLIRRFFLVDIQCDTIVFERNRESLFPYSLFPIFAANSKTNKL